MSHQDSRMHVMAYPSVKCFSSRNVAQGIAGVVLAIVHCFLGILAVRQRVE